MQDSLPQITLYSCLTTCIPVLVLALLAVAILRTRFFRGLLGMVGALVVGLLVLRDKRGDSDQGGLPAILPSARGPAARSRADEIRDRYDREFDAQLDGAQPARPGYLPGESGGLEEADQPPPARRWRDEDDDPAAYIDELDEGEF